LGTGFLFDSHVYVYYSFITFELSNTVKSVKDKFEKKMLMKISNVGIWRFIFLFKL
jgi:hypothetical protein